MTINLTTKERDLVREVYRKSISLNETLKVLDPNKQDEIEFAVHQSDILSKKVEMLFVFCLGFKQDQN
jgi:hypothetical protein